MIYDNLTDEQRTFAEHPDEAFVQACPGAGKTRTLVERLHNLNADLPPRRGIAVLSYTNSAVEEFAQRCREVGIDEALRFPNFIGTFDGFLRHFIVLPAGTAVAASRPTVVDSWDTLQIELRLQAPNHFAGPGLSLDAFDSDLDQILLDKIRHVGLKQHVERNQAQYERAARARRDGLFRQGYLSAHDVRSHSRRRIQDPAWRAALGRALAARFAEVIVDEAQDCNPHDLQIIEWLREQGIRVTLVCDVDQSIYGFRHGVPGNLQAFAETYSEENRLALTGNFRSSPAICSFASTLRPEARVDEALGDCAAIEHPVLLLTYNGAAPHAGIGNAFAEQLRRFEFEPNEGIVLSHKGRSARGACGITTDGERGQSTVETLAHAVGSFWSPEPGSRRREAALQIIERLILDFEGKRLAGEHVTRTISRLGLDRRYLRRQALRIATQLNPSCEDNDAARAAWIDSARAQFGALILELAAGRTLGRLLCTPPRGTWSKHLEGGGREGGLAYGTIHEAKGREYEAVCVVVPPNRGPNNYSRQLVDAWEARADDEGKRVAYVGATRAKRLLAVAIPTALVGRVAAILEQSAVPVERIQVVLPDAQVVRP